MTSNSLYPLRGKTCSVDVNYSDNNDSDDLLNEQDAVNYFKEQLTINLSQCGLTMLTDNAEAFDINVIINSVKLIKVGGGPGSKVNKVDLLMRLLFISIRAFMGGLISSDDLVETHGVILIKDRDEEIISHKTSLNVLDTTNGALKKAAETICYRINEKLLNIYR